MQRSIRVSTPTAILCSVALSIRKDNAIASIEVGPISLHRVRLVDEGVAAAGEIGGADELATCFVADFQPVKMRPLA
ncbi:hypothetical protein C5748_17680 [Phyllobacterium phragmitis]|uniref:Uncharacterized protein n=1 Tax=Phyllobacterium phragmitis TaxID=2670329 RepID=A0A2S9IP37_9HYPH|nr:hypothetical protein C5748_17680 [Phyllobacterium phragmitis]